MADSYHAALDTLASPKFVVVLFTGFLIAYLIFIDLEGGFSKNFLHFGPGTDETNTTKFIGITLDTWPKVLIIYGIAFCAAAMTAYYSMVTQNNLHMYLWNPAVKVVPFSKTWTYAIVLMEPFLYNINYIISILSILTMQLQFIIPEFLGGFLASFPFDLQRLSKLKFTSP